jgi:hypothetical protein
LPGTLERDQLSMLGVNTHWAVDLDFLYLRTVAVGFRPDSEPLQPGHCRHMTDTLAFHVIDHLTDG